MRKVTLTEIFTHPYAQKYMKRAGIVHAVSTAYHAFHIAKENGADPDSAAKAALLHDIGHYTWYNNGTWDYDLYKENDIHAIKGAERAHKLLVRLGEDPKKAKEIALAILLHTDSYLPESSLARTPLQEAVARADEMDEEPGGMHHYRQMDDERTIKMLQKLDRMVENEQNRQTLKHSVS
ncbi:HD domain-containing protein [Fictibacillus aquaticus]|uniref:Phosphohydrolase n=1 Tax=Fictibacillus aquaticus TaxID=2021314 RepID=A0A235FCY8_9BACL|nr:HD domain-containing protein [Fictibacillus aquaticus]OYD59069.1 phosphohydrolase [Fictibacillus aquaticus]